MTFDRILLVTTSAIASCVALSAPAMAQTAETTAEATTAAAAAPEGQAALAASAASQDEPVKAEIAEEEGVIVVTAQKRAENVQDVPISIAAFSGKALEEANVENIQDLGKFVPNFSAIKGTQTSAIRLNIRGVGAFSNSATEPSVAPFIDGVYIPRAGSIISTFMDIESVEVLRGPQGTLFGRNASVGALSLHSATPKDSFSARATAEVASYGRYKLDGYVNTPITDKVAVRLAGQANWFNGYWENDFDGKNYGGQDDYALRASVKADLGKVEWIIRADYSKINGDGAVNSDFDASSVSPAQLAALKVRLGGQLPDTDIDDRVMNQYVTADLDDRQYGIMSEANFELGGGTLRLINSYRNWKNDQLDGDIVLMPRPLISRVGNYSSESDSHELQYISPVNQWLGGRLDLVAGLYYYHEKYELGEQFNLNSQFCNTLAPAPFRPACNAYLAATGGVNATNQDVSQTTKSFAAYSQVNFKIIDPLTLVLGGRWTNDKKSASYSQVITTFNPVISAILASSLRAPEVLTLPDVDDSRFTYRIGLNYEPTEELLFFASYSTGFKSGGYNSGAGTPSLSPGNNPALTKRVFDPETVKDYEVGMKSTWFDKKLLANITFYRMDIDGYQDRSFDGVSFVIRNAGSLRQQGFEFDSVLHPMRHLALSASVAYLDSKFTDFEGASGLPGLPPGTTQDLTGARATFSPKWSGRVGADWSGEFAGSGGMGWNLNSNLTFVSNQYIGAVTDNNPQTKANGYALLGARFTINGKDDRWSFSLYGDNLTNKQYAIARFYQPLGAALGLNNGVFPGSTAVRRAHADPRTVGFSGTLNF